MGIGQLGVDDEPEVTVVFALLSSELNVPGDGGSLKVNKQKILQSSVGEGRLDPQDIRN